MLAGETQWTALVITGTNRETENLLFHGEVATSSSAHRFLDRGEDPGCRDAANLQE
ncbi:MAG: hypothetical protein OXU81_13725 [Gammaproteobacteria bacterium]|nr:hypothetical protein [Gammaproteobacteria bacterium]